MHETSQYHVQVRTRDRWRIRGLGRCGKRKQGTACAAPGPSHSGETASSRLWEFVVGPEWDWYPWPTASRVPETAPMSLCSSGKTMEGSCHLGPKTRNCTGRNVMEQSRPLWNAEGRLDGTAEPRRSLCPLTSSLLEWPSS